jgi:uncharacterized protein
MTQQILFIHGAGEGAYEADNKLATSLQSALGTDYRVITPQMPSENAPEYARWKAQIAKELATLDGPVILVGHSLGGSVLIKYLSEEQIDKPIAGLFMVASPFWGAPDWEVDEYTLHDDFAAHLPNGLPLYIYHGQDDDIVSFDHLTLYAARLPQAKVQGFAGRGHQFNDDLSEVAADIKRL